MPLSTKSSRISQPRAAGRAGHRPLATLAAFLLTSALAISQIATPAGAHQPMPTSETAALPARIAVDPNVRVPAVVREFRGEPGGERGLAREGAKTATASELPQWVRDAKRAGLERLEDEPWQYGLSSPETELRVLRASQDERGRVDLRMTQVHDGLDVIGGEVLVHFDER